MKIQIETVTCIKFIYFSHTYIISVCIRICIYIYLSIFI